MWQLQDSISLNCFESIMNIGESGALRTRLRLRGNSFFSPLNWIYPRSLFWLTKGCRGIIKPGKSKLAIINQSQTTTLPLLWLGWNKYATNYSPSQRLRLRMPRHRVHYVHYATQPMCNIFVAASHHCLPWLAAASLWIAFLYTITLFIV